MTKAKPILNYLEAGDPLTESWLEVLVDHVRANAGHGAGMQAISTGIGTLYRATEQKRELLFRIDTGEFLPPAQNSLTNPSACEANLVVPDEDNPSTSTVPGQMKELTSQTYTLVNRSKHISASQNSLVWAKPWNGEWLVTSVLES